jgi:uncharacterized cupredoxin-like copper-binding protein
VTRALLALILAGLAAASCQAAAPREVGITLHYSHFAPTVIDVPRGVPVTFVLHNDDPIEHEWIIGDASVHERHRTGTEPVHASIPTEVTVPALSTVRTTITFDHAGELTYVCHLPGHEAYGMVGRVRVGGA